MEGDRSIAAKMGCSGETLRNWVRQDERNRGLRATTVDQFIEVVDLYIRWYNAKRIKVSLDSLSPVEYRESLGIAA